MPARRRAPPERVFLLSPASCSGARAQLLLRADAAFELACRVRGPGVPIGEVFAFLSGLYFRGKLGYALRFARPPLGVGGTWIITPNRGLLGSVATGKYLDVLLPVLGPRLRFPAEFVGRGDMSRGGLLLRSARAGTELEYRAVDGAARRGSRPAKLGP